MRPTLRHRDSLVILLGVGLATGSANAQPIMIILPSIEARVAQANNVVIGAIENVSCEVIVAAGRSRVRDCENWRAGRISRGSICARRA